MSNTISALDSSYRSIISSLMEVERQPLVRLTERRDAINVQKGVYNDLRTYLDGLQKSVKSLISSDASYSFSEGRKVTVSGVASGSTILSATAGASAVPGHYTISNIVLAQQHRVRSDRQVSASADLGKTGSFMINSGGERSQTTKSTVANTITAFDVAELAAGQTELKGGSYYVETRQENGAWQFRVVDANGAAVSVRNGTGDTFGSDWQALDGEGGVAGTIYDTGRGLKITFGSSDFAVATKGDTSHPAAQVSYVAKNATIDVTTSDSLIEIAEMINEASYPAGHKVTATVVDSQLVISPENSGLDYTLAAQDVSGSVLSELGILSGGNFAHVLNTARNATFSVNGLPVERSGNQNLTDVIYGVTLNLASDAEGKSAVIDISSDSATQTTSINEFISKFNSLQTYLGNKVSTIKGENGTYTRGALAGDSMFVTLRQDMFRMVNKSHVNSGSLTSLRQIGISLDDNLKLAVSDTTKLNEALKTNRAGVVALIDQVMGELDQKLGRYTGTSGYVERTTKSLTQQLDNTKSQITLMNERLSMKEASLIQQYGELQAQIMSMTYQQQQFSAIYGSTNTYS